VQIPDDLRYTENHEWIADTGDGSIRIGITDYAQDALGDVVFVDIPDAGSTVTAGEPFAEIESTKSVADVYSPITGTIVAVNEALSDTPELVNSDPYGAGWFAELSGDTTAVESLMDAAAYTAFTE
jgi:glycine cleavage system H protein